MSTITNNFTGLDPRAFGLPGEQELVALAAAYLDRSGALPLTPPPKGPTPSEARSGWEPYGAFQKLDATEAAYPAGGFSMVPDESPGHRAVLPDAPPDKADFHSLPVFTPTVSPWNDAGPGARLTPHEAPPPHTTSAVCAALPYVGETPLSKIRADFPILSETVEGRPLIWLDNSATTQKPQQVISRISHYYAHENSNVHRGAHTLAARSTDAYEEARARVASFIGAPAPDNIVWVRGATEGLNLVAQAFVRPLLRPGDEIIITHLEHHANIVPWQILAQESGAVLRVAPVDDSGQIIVSEYSKLFNRKTRFVSATHVSNALGTIVPIEELAAIAHAHGVRICIDGAQSVSHLPVNVVALDVDFFVFSGHKIYAPTGIGALYGKTDALEEAKPYQSGGNMIADVTFERTQYRKAPAKFEAGTGNIADAVGLGAALEYVSSIGLADIAAYEHELLRQGLRELGKIPGLRLVGTAAQKTSVLSFVLDGVSLEQAAKHLSGRGIAVRAGHHCAQPILRRFGLEGTVRPSVAFYNTPGEIEALARAVRELM